MREESTAKELTLFGDKEGDEEIMKIGMMGAWNTDSGASLHAELIGRAWVEEGHKLSVFTFYDYAFHGTQIIGEDEDYVKGCFTVEGYSPPKLEPIPFLTAEYEVFVVQDLGMLPKDLLAKIFHRIKKKAKVANVIHDGALSSNPSFYQFEWDAIVCFDQRYRNFLMKAYEPSKVHMIPYPCYPMMKGNKQAKREKLGLPKNRKITFCFGPAAKLVTDIVPSIAELRGDYPILLLAVTKDKGALERFKALQELRILDIELREETPDMGRLYDYLHASDVLLINKQPADHVVVSSTVFQCLGSGCPIVARDSNYVEYYDREVMKYSTPKELQGNLRSVFDQTEEYRITVRAAEDYVEKNSAQIVGKGYIELFNSLP